jgi:ADP-ribose pyrophosphatase YjhB (NUDIX family)
MEPGERAVGAVVREVLEGIGLDIEPLELIGVYSAPEYALACSNGDWV